MLTNMSPSGPGWSTMESLCVWMRSKNGQVSNHTLYEKCIDCLLFRSSPVVVQKPSLDETLNCTIDSVVSVVSFTHSRLDYSLESLRVWFFYHLRNTGNVPTASRASASLTRTERQLLTNVHLLTRVKTVICARFLNSWCNYACPRHKKTCFLAKQNCPARDNFLQSWGAQRVKAWKICFRFPTRMRRRNLTQSRIAETWIIRRPVRVNLQRKMLGSNLSSRYVLVFYKLAD